MTIYTSSDLPTVKIPDELLKKGELAQMFIETAAKISKDAATQQK